VLKAHSRLFEHLTLAGDLVLIAACWISAYLVRFHVMPAGDIPPFRAIRRALLERLGMREMTYGWPVEMVIRVARQGGKIVEVPVTQRPRLAGRSKVAGTLWGSLRAGCAFLAVALRAGGEGQRL